MCAVLRLVSVCCTTPGECEQEQNTHGVSANKKGVAVLRIASCGACRAMEEEEEEEEESLFRADAVNEEEEYVF